MIKKILLFILLFFLFSDIDVYAATTTIDYIPQNSSASQEGYSSDPVDDSKCSAIPKPANICSNSNRIGDTTCAGEATCTGGNTWSKYNLGGCYSDALDPTSNAWLYFEFDLICSIGDKCISGETSLRAGFCDCSYGASPYKYCCTDLGTPEACIQSGTQDTSFPPEGQCPGGYIVDGSRVRSSQCTPLVTCTVGQSCTGTGGCQGTTTCPNGVNGAPVCSCPTPPPPGACPTSGGWGGSCSGPGTQKAEACAFDNTCNRCSLAICTEKEPGLYCWLNTGQCYEDANLCKGFGSCGAGVCTPGETRVRCSEPQACILP